MDVLPFSSPETLFVGLDIPCHNTLQGYLHAALQA